MYPTQDDVTQMNQINISNGLSSNLSKESIDYEEMKYFWIFVESFLFIVIVLGNALTILAIVWSRRLRNVISNYFIINLAASDLMVGLMLPYHAAFYIEHELNYDKPICILRFVIINVGCIGSIYNLIVIAIDRYIAILHPLSYNIHATQKHVMLIIVVTWIYTMSMSSIPIYWNEFDASKECELKALPRYCNNNFHPFPDNRCDNRSNSKRT